MIKRITAWLLIFLGMFIGAFHYWSPFRQQILLVFSEYQFTQLLPKFTAIAIIVIVGKIMHMIIQQILDRYSKLIAKEASIINAKKLLGFLLWLIVLFACLSVFVDNVSVFLTSLGLVGFGLTFALQKPILNFVGWITILFGKAYSVGDRIQVGDHRGDVKDIELMYTRLDGLLDKTDELSGKIVTVPNELVLTTPVINFTKSGYYVWDELEITITYESNWKKAKEILEKLAMTTVKKYIIPSNDKNVRLFQAINIPYLAHHKGKEDNKKEEHDKAMIDKHKDKLPIVRVLLRDSAIALNVRYLAYYKRLLVIKSEINSSFLDETEKTKDVEIAYPHVQIVTEGKTKT